jgi:hypothetical protein
MFTHSNQTNLTVPFEGLQTYVALVLVILIALTVVVCFLY